MSNTLGKNLHARYLLFLNVKYKYNYNYVKNVYVYFQMQIQMYLTPLYYIFYYNKINHTF